MTGTALKKNLQNGNKVPLYQHSKRYVNTTKVHIQMLNSVITSQTRLMQRENMTCPQRVLHIDEVQKACLKRTA